MFYGKLPIIILSEMASSKSDSINGYIAAYILGHLKEIKNDTIRELAGKMNVSASSSTDNGSLFICRFRNMELGFSYVTANRKRDLVSHLLLGVDNSAVVDHINGNPFDNRRGNLRVVSPVENHWNYRLSERNTTGYKGIYRDNKSSGYHARICEHGRRHYLGLFPTPTLAALAYDNAARLYFGEFATLNFPSDGEQSCLPRYEGGDA